MAYTAGSREKSNSLIIHVILEGIVRMRKEIDTERRRMEVLMAVLDKVFWLESDPDLNLASISLVMIDTLKIKTKIHGTNEYTQESKTA